VQGVFGQNGGFAAPTPSATSGRGASAASSSAAADRTSSMAYLDSLMGVDVPGLSPVPSATAPLAALGGVASSGGVFQKDVRRTALGSSIAKTTQRGGQKSIAGSGRGAGSLLTAGTAVSGRAGRGSSKLGPAFAGSSAALGGSAASGAAQAQNRVPIAAASAAAQQAQGYGEELLEGDEGEEDQLLYEGGAGDDGDYDDYDDEYY
jgi:hypothetical protein